MEDKGGITVEPQEIVVPTMLAVGEKLVFDITIRNFSEDARILTEIDWLGLDSDSAFSFDLTGLELPMTLTRGDTAIFKLTCCPPRTGEFRKQILICTFGSPNSEGRFAIGRWPECKAGDKDLYAA